jgi:hypothetical protein
MNLIQFEDRLIEAPQIDSPKWNCIVGSEKAEYFSKSPYAIITAYARGFVVQNVVTAGKHPVATWAEATSLREEIASRYQRIASRAF